MTGLVKQYLWGSLPNEYTRWLTSHLPASSPYEQPPNQGSASQSPKAAQQNFKGLTLSSPPPLKNKPTLKSPHIPTHLLFFFLLYKKVLRENWNR